MHPSRKTAVAAGTFFLITEVAAIGGQLFYRPALTNADYVVGPGTDAGVPAGALCELILVMAIIATGVILFPVLKRHNEAAALGYVCGRLLESSVIVVGIAGVLSLMRLRRDSAEGVGAGADSSVAVGRALVAMHDWTFLLGPDFILGMNTLVLASLVYRSRLVPRRIAVLGLVGGPMIAASAIAVMFGLYEQVSVPGSIAAIPVFAWELALAFWLIVKGFRPGVAPRESRTAVLVDAAA